MRGVGWSRKKYASAGAGKSAAAATARETAAVERRRDGIERMRRMRSAGRSVGGVSVRCLGLEAGEVGWV